MRDAGVPFPRKELVHGSVYRYDEGCRCADCRAAKAAYTKASVARQRGGAKPNGAVSVLYSGSRQERGLSPGLVADERNGHAGAGEPRRVGQAVETAVAPLSQVPEFPDVIEAAQVTDAAGVVWTRLAACWAEHADPCGREWKFYESHGVVHLARCYERSAWTSAAGGLCGRHFRDALEVGA